MPPILLGNLFSVLATGTDVLSASRKSPRSMLLWQTASQFFLALTSLVLGGYSAVVQNVVSMVRNLTALCKRGGSMGYFDLLASADLASPFDEKTVRDVTDSVVKIIEEFERKI